MKRDVTNYDGIRYSLQPHGLRSKAAYYFFMFVLAFGGALAVASPASAATNLVSTPSTNTLIATPELRSGGSYQYVAGALKVSVSDAANTSNNKVQLAFPTPMDFPLSDLGVLDVSATGSGYANGPGLNIFIDLDNDGDVEGTLVFEEVYGQDFWVPGTNELSAKAPSNTGGNGSANHGTLAEWLSVIPDATVLGVALNYGSGVPVSEWFVTHVMFANTTYTFNALAAPSVTVSPSPVAVAGPTVTVTRTVTVAPSPTASPTPSSTPSASPTATLTPRPSLTPSPAASTDDGGFPLAAVAVGVAAVTGAGLITAGVVGIRRRRYQGRHATDNSQTQMLEPVEDEYSVSDYDPDLGGYAGDTYDEQADTAEFQRVDDTKEIPKSE